MSPIRTVILGIVLSAIPVATVALAEDQGVVNVLIESASTPAQHQAIANYFRAKADEARKEAADHRAMAKTYSGQKASISAAQMEHCNKLASLSESEAAEYQQLAMSQEAAAKK